MQEASPGQAGARMAARPARTGHPHLDPPQRAPAHRHPRAVPGIDAAHFRADLSHDTQDHLSQIRARMPVLPGAAATGN